MDALTPYHDLDAHLPSDVPIALDDPLDGLEAWGAHLETLGNAQGNGIAVGKKGDTHMASSGAKGKDSNSVAYPKKLVVFQMAFLGSTFGFDSLEGNKAFDEQSAILSVRMLL